MGDLKAPWYSREQDPYGPPQMARPIEPMSPPQYQGGPPAMPAIPVPQDIKKPKQTAPSIDNSARASSNVRLPMPGKQMPGGTPEWYGRATQQMPPQFTPPPGVGLQPPRPDAPERRRWRG